MEPDQRKAWFVGLIAPTAKNYPRPPFFSENSSYRDATARIVRHPENGNGRIAQLVEQLTLNQRVLGSSPSASTIFQFNFNTLCRHSGGLLFGLYELGSSLGSRLHNLQKIARPLDA